MTTAMLGLLYTLFCDVSYYQAYLDDRYPYWFIAFRSNDGNFTDPHFEGNLRQTASMLARRKLLGFIVYCVFEGDGHVTRDTLRNILAVRRGFFVRWIYNRMAVMIDVESWGGKITGNHQAQIRQLREDLIRDLNNHRIPLFRKRLMARDRKRVLIYGNYWDLKVICPDTGDAVVVLARYNSDDLSQAEFPHLIQQFSSSVDVPPFGPCDINRAYASPRAFGAAIGVLAPRKGRQGRKPLPPSRPVKPRPVTTYVVQHGDTLSYIAFHFHLTVAQLVKANPQIKNPNVIAVGQILHIPKG